MLLIYRTALIGCDRKTEGSRDRHETSLPVGHVSIWEQIIVTIK
jgi:hypothetical protein